VSDRMGTAHGDFHSSGSCEMHLLRWQKTMMPLAIVLWLGSVCAMAFPGIEAMRGPDAAFDIGSAVFLLGMAIAASALMLGELRRHVARVEWGPDGVTIHSLLGRPRIVPWARVDQLQASPPEAGVREWSKGRPDVAHLFVARDRRPYILRTRWDAPMYQLVGASEQKTTVLRVMHPEGKRLPK